ncbi:MBL fold metallo-hydrolase [Synergistaceae bacterium OttesenSCG-928-I11]|nr:MBL fold metallo-hydrolase [Synergistaceae bacterium OttesenSCG-928-I11]
MYELIQVGENTFYIECPSRMGLYRYDGNKICLVDSGNDKEAGRRILKRINESGWELGMILNTHSNCDHIGGNAFLQKRTGAPAYSVGLEAVLSVSTFMEPAFLYGGYPPRDLRHKFLVAEPSDVRDLSEAVLPEGIEPIRLDGHMFQMVGFHTSDDVWFLADALTSPHILEKYHIPFLFDTREYLRTLDTIEGLEGKLFIPSHAAPVENIRPLVAVNREKIHEILARLEEICASPTPFEEILKRVFDGYGLSMNFDQYVLVGSTVRSMLAYLRDEGRMDVSFEENRLLWMTCA